MGINNKIYIVSNTVLLPTIDNLNQHKNSNEIIFIGKMSYEPNVVAVDYFVKEIFSYLKKDFPNLIFKIIGANPKKKVLNLSKNNGIIVTGYVESIIPFLRNNTIVIAPMLTGAGIQNKIIQAMSYGCCVATTPIGAEGLNIENNEIAIFDGVEDWRKGLHSLLNNLTLRKDMGNKARKYIEINLNINIINKQFWNFIESGENNYNLKNI